MEKNVVALLVFLGAYILFVLLPRKRSWVAMGAALMLLVTGTLSAHEMLEAVNWNVMGIFLGTLIAAEIFIESRFPAFFAEMIVNRAPNTAWAILFICALTGFISAFAENVATVLIVAPIALSICKKLDINPVNVMIAIAISSNLQGAATLIGDPPSMILGGYSKMTFMSRGRKSQILDADHPPLRDGRGVGMLVFFRQGLLVASRHNLYGHRRADVVGAYTLPLGAIAREPVEIGLEYDLLSGGDLHHCI